MARALVIAGMSSGVGKTTFVTGLIVALRKRGYRVQPFKVGPDYLDPTYHTLAASPEFATRNLDTWLLPPANLQELYRRAAAKADFTLIEGVMGLYDGKNGQADEGSTAALAKLLGVPVVAVLDIGKLSRTAGALALGLQKFDPELNLVGFLLNNAGSPTHYEWAKQAVESATGLPVLGGLPKSEEWKLPERHLGLVPAGEGAEADAIQGKLERLAEHLAQSVDLDRLDGLAELPGSFPEEAANSGESLFPPQPVAPYLRIGLAQDAAFGFYYRDNLDLLKEWGTELVPFSPLHDQTLPPDLDGLYLGGGFPEVFAAELAANQAIQEEIRRAAERGLPVYAECGGLMYLGRSLRDFEGTEHRMVGLLPYGTAMQNRRVKLGYTEAQSAREDHPLIGPGESLRTHEFHWSVLEGQIETEQAAYFIPAQDNRPEGWLKGNVLASYLHVHFGADRRLAPRLLNWYASAKVAR